MKAAMHSRALARIFLVAGFAAALSAAPACAQKPGGSITVGQELDIPGFDPLKVGVYDTSANTAAAAIFDTLTTLDDKGEPQPKLALSWTPFGRLQDLDLQAAARRQIPRRHAVQRAGGEGEFRPPEGSRQQVPLRLLHRLHQRRAGARRIDGRLQSERSVGEPAGADDHPELEQRRAFADGLEDQGRRLQPQSRRHRPLHPEIMDRGRPHGAGEEPRLLEQGPSLSRPHRPEAAAGCAVALRQPAIGRGRHRLGR